MARQKRATNADKNAFIEIAKAKIGGVVTRAEVMDLCDSEDLPVPTWLMGGKYSAGRAKYRLPGLFGDVAMASTVVVEDADAETITSNEDVIENVAAVVPIKKKASSPKKSNAVVNGGNSLVPNRFKNYVPFGHFKDVASVIESGFFYPIFITGLSGNGKTMMVEQVCAKQKRELIKVSVTIETDEDDLLGGFRLEDGETVFFKGPVVEAMERGAVLLLDEVDLASNKIMCLQPVLEGNGVLLKKINEFVKPAPGFTIVATANTKGKGDDAGRFIGTNILNEAFLERFPITFEQSYPTVAVEKKIVKKELVSAGAEDDDFAEKLVNWADIIRKTFFDGGVDEIIATRRLVHIAKAYGVFKDRKKAIELCVNRFDDETKESFISLYTKVDADVEGDSDNTDAPSAGENDTEELIPF